MLSMAEALFEYGLERDLAAKVVEIQNAKVGGIVR